MPKISDEQRAAARQRLIDATVAVVERDGVEGLTTRAIVQEAGVSAGMFYGHFDSKEALLAAVVDHKVDEFTTMVAAEIDLGTPLEGVLRSMLDHLVHTLDLRALAVFRNASSSDEGVATQRRINERIVAAFTPLIRTAMETGLVRPEIDPEAVVELIDLVLDGLNRRRASDGFVTSDDRVAAVVVGAVERFLLTDQGATP